MISGKLSRQALVIIAAMAVPMLPFAIIGELPGERWLSAADEDAVMFALTGGGLLALDIFLPVPSSIMGSLLGSRLGFVGGFTAAFVGLVAGNVLGYQLARLAIRRFDGKLPDFSAGTTLAVVFLTRPVPVVAEAMVLTAGAAGMPFRHFVVASGAGNAIYAAALAANGAALIPETLIGPWLLVPMSIPLAGWAAWQLFARSAASSASETES